MYAFYLGQRRSVEIQRKLEAVEIHNELQRHKEERTLLLSEMQNWLQYYHRVVIPSLSHDIQGIPNISDMYIIGIRIHS